MKLGTLLKQIPIRQSVVLIDHGKVIATGHSECTDIIAHKDKTVGLIEAKDNMIVINIYNR